MNIGLSEIEARKRLAQDGPNELLTSRPRGLLRLLRDVTLEPMLLLLVACGAIYMVLGDRGEALMLLGFVFVVMGITFVQRPGRGGQGSVRHAPPRIFEPRRR